MIHINNKNLTFLLDKRFFKGVSCHHLVYLEDFVGEKFKARHSIVTKSSILAGA